MTIENKELYNLFKSVKTGFKDYEMPLNGYGLYIEGFDGGITVYAYNGALYRKTIYGDNKREFCSYIADWKKESGITYADCLEVESIDKKNSDKAAEKISRFRAGFESERFFSFSVKAREFFKAVYAVDIINKGEKRHDIVISAYNGKMDIASWSGGDSGAWQLDTPVQASGAVMVNRKHLDNIRNSGNLNFACLEYNGKTGLYINGDVEVIIPTYDIDPAIFMEVLEYEYKRPEKPVIEQKPELKPMEIEKPLEKPALKLVKSEMPVKNKAERRLEKAEKERAYWTAKGWTWDDRKRAWQKACNI